MRNWEGFGRGEKLTEWSSFRWGEEADGMVRPTRLVLLSATQFLKRKSRILEPVAGVPPPSQTAVAARHSVRVETGWS